MKRLLISMMFVVLSFGAAMAQSPDSGNDDMNSVDVMPTFQDQGVENFCYWMMSNVAYPAEAIDAGVQGMVLVKFVIYPDGKIYDYEIVQSPDDMLSKAVVEVLDKSNLLEDGWKPAEVDGKPVKMSFTIPVNFAMSK